MSVPVHTYVVFGPQRLPEVHLIDARTAALLSDRENAVRDRGKAVEATFGVGARSALPAWNVDCMEFIALEYSGPHEIELKALCAAIALGKPFGPDADWRKPGGGGERVPVIPRKPTPRGPAGAKAERPKVRKLSRA